MTTHEESARPTGREELVDEVLLAGRELSTAAVLFHTALASRQGLSATDTKALDLVARLGPMTAGDLARHLALKPASVTALIGRLEDKDALRKAPDPGDGRKVVLHFNEEFAARNLHYFADLVGSLRELCEHYTDEQLATIASFTREAARRQAEATQRLA
ncbi:MarR family transcriptional regulator [Streptomyces sp. NBC_01016]|uniref:MarR family transcriptional regulator n=1 Tax=Streptomyces sp. NBC_01016 TaxID=2903720 RepID=UPI0022582F31|nr:MarR family transcriptional regulator [Streptomyces sp. NBC_01016]MCX4834705.1 MarR family transcriptional regulator [Streptomyces sp. NBC_01016]